MIIPSSLADRENLYRELIEYCFESREDRRNQYNLLRNWYLYGQDQTQMPTEYNMLFPHIDNYSSYLFSGETTNFVIEIPKKSTINYNLEVEKSKQLTPALNDAWHDSNTDIMFNEALNWALVFNTSFLKIVPIGKNEYSSHLVEPHMVGVLREDIPGLDQQEVVCHEYFMTENALRRKIGHFGSEEQKRILAGLVFEESNQVENIMPSGIKQLIINTVSPNITGDVSQQTQAKFDLIPKNKEKGIWCQELWVFDDNIGDYRTVTMLDGEKILHDAEKNIFVANELPFIKITPNIMYNYFWGRSELMLLINLQQWVNKRIPEIKELLAQQTNPPRGGFGLSGSAEEKMKALMVAGGLITDPNPASMSKFEVYRPEVPENVFREINMIKEIFNEISGIREIMKGGGESGVRSEVHAGLLARLGSSRAKKKAFILEDNVEKCATILLKCIKKYDDTYYKTENGVEFVANQLTGFATVKVDAHSSSPIFIEQQMEKAQMLFEAGAIDKEDLIDAVRYHNAEYIKTKLKKREEAEAAAAAKDQEKGGE